MQSILSFIKLYVIHKVYELANYFLLSADGFCEKPCKTYIIRKVIRNFKINKID